MKRRLRKKLRRGEFTMYGFDVTCRVDGDSEAFFWRMVEWAEARGLCVGGGIGERYSLYVTSCGCKACGRRWETANEDDRQALTTYLRNAGADEVLAGPLMDIWDA